MLPFHLCQPGGGASCGACCGLYNFRDHSREALTAALNRHTDRLRDAPKTREAFSEAARELKAQEHSPAFPDVRVCPLLGFIDGERTRVGCLAHPLVTGGIDLRDCGAYTAELCQSFQCPSFIWLTPSQAELVRKACPDWYLYGLVLTDVELVRGTLSLIERALGESVDARRVLECSGALQAISALFALKERPLDRHAPTVFGRFAPDDAGAPSLRTIDYAALGARAAPEDDVLLCLGFAPTTPEGLEHARAVVRAGILRIADALSAK